MTVSKDPRYAKYFQMVKVVSVQYQNFHLFALHMWYVTFLNKYAEITLNTTFLFSVFKFLFVIFFCFICETCVLGVTFILVVWGEIGCWSELSSVSRNWLLWLVNAVTCWLATWQIIIWNWPKEISHLKVLSACFSCVASYMYLKDRPSWLFAFNIQLKPKLVVIFRVFQYRQLHLKWWQKDWNLVYLSKFWM